MSDALTRCLVLAPLLWPAHDPAAFDVRLSRGDACISAALLAGGTSLAVVGADDGVAALDALAATLAAAAHDRSDSLLRAAGLPMPCADHKATLAARNAELERELTDRTWERDHLRRGLFLLRCAVGGLACPDVAIPVDPAELRGHVDEGTANALDLLAARVDREPPQRATGLGAGVAADVVDGWRERLTDVPVRLGGPSALLNAVIDEMRAGVAAARQDVRSADRGAEAVEPRERVGSAVERIDIGVAMWGESADGEFAHLYDADGVHLVGPVVARRLAAMNGQHRGRRVRVVCEVLAEGSDVHTDSLSPAMGCRDLGAR